MKSIFFHSFADDSAEAVDIADHRSLSEQALVRLMNSHAAIIQRHIAAGACCVVARSYFRRYWLALRLLRMQVVQFS